MRRELQFYEHVSSLNSPHHSQSFIRGLYETFELSGPFGQHLCLVHPPMHMTIQELQYRNASHRLNEKLLKWTLFNLLNALSFLHDEAGVVHTGEILHKCVVFQLTNNLDINTSNIMLTLDDKSILDDFEKDEADEPSPMKVIDKSRTLYGSRKFGLPKDSQWGQPVLCDFGEARIGFSHRGLVQPELYRAPEVLFDMEWGTGADIWNVAVMVYIPTAKSSYLIANIRNRSGICSRIGIYLMRWMRNHSHQQRTILPKWLHTLGYLLPSI